MANNHHEVKQEKKYNIFKNNSGDILICIKPIDTIPHNPQILYAKGDHAVLFRDRDNIIVLDYLNPDVKKDFSRQQKALIVEFTEDDTIKHEYYASIHLHDKLPIDESKLYTIDDIPKEEVDMMIKSAKLEF